jgi:pimeloyl-ACP methyl ester carboxylesterase
MSGLTRRESLILGAAGLGLFASSVRAEAKSQVESVITTDNVPIKFSYYPAIAEKNDNDLSTASVVLMLHGEKGSRLQWDKGSAPAGKEPFPAVLQNVGFAVVTVDLRKHGQSVAAGAVEPLGNEDYFKMGLDLKAVKDHIQKLHQEKQLNMSKMAIISTGFSAPVAAAFAESDWKQPPYDDSPVPALKTPRGQDVKALVMISPDATAGRLSTNRSLAALNKLNLSFLFMAGKQDPIDKGTAKNCFKVCGSDKKADGRVVLAEPDLKERGIDLFGKIPQHVEVPILKFLDERLKKITVPWVDRRSRVDR